MSLVREVWFVIAFLFLIGPYYYWKVRTGFHFLYYEIYILLMISVFPFLSGIAALREFGQPIVYGVLAQRGMVLGVGALALIYSIRRRVVTLRDVEKALLFLAWSTLGLNLTIYLLFDPSQFIDIDVGFVSGQAEDASFRLSAIFIVFGFIYYAFVAFRKKSAIHYVFPVIFFTYLILASGGRSLIISVSLAFLFFSIRWASLTRRIIFVPTVVVAVAVFISMLFIINEDYMAKLGNKMSDAFTVVLTGNETMDASANSRIIETAIAMPYIEKNIMLGNGDISNRWGGGYEGVLGGYFYPSDIGIVGVLYMFGVFGLILFLIQFLFAIQFSLRVKHRTIHSPLLDATKGFLFYYFVHSLVTGSFVHNSEVGFLFIALLWCIAFEENKDVVADGSVISKMVRK